MKPWSSDRSTTTPFSSFFFSEIEKWHDLYDTRTSKGLSAWRVVSHWESWWAERVYTQQTQQTQRVGKTVRARRRVLLVGMRNGCGMVEEDGIAHVNVVRCAG